MKKKGVILHVLLTLILLFPIVFQLVHIYEHHSEQNKKQLELVSNSNSGNQRIADDTLSEDCFVCDYTFTVQSLATLFSYSFSYDCAVVATLLLYIPTAVVFYCGSLFSLRAPPVL
ncbi:hypothetical protein [Flavobacterium sp. UMI-01]|uniref:hypothetical protein n=1 Tax=Flavobacterium sp. UMI-01 TaxID=1441053 RepID=UPI001C7CFFDE|nr:hypothetical protein [Flavobacterium sp. UMI-01]